MATTTVYSRTDNSTMNEYGQSRMENVMDDDHRYPSFSPQQQQSQQNQQQAQQQQQHQQQQAQHQQQRRRTSAANYDGRSSPLVSSPQSYAELSPPTLWRDRSDSASQARQVTNNEEEIEQQELNEDQQQQQQQLSYSLPTNRRVVERYSLEDINNSQRIQMPLVDPRLISNPDYDLHQQQLSRPPSQPRRQSHSPANSPSERPSSFFAPVPKNPSQSPNPGPSTYQAVSTPPTSNSMAIPVSPKFRAYAQQPTYVNPPQAQPIQPLQQEEVCVECAMRDQDMADVDVTSPGIWERESDVYYHDLVQLERDEEASGIVNTDHSRPRSKGGLLTEPNVKIWLTMNPREPAARQQTLDKYVRSQITLLEAEALAHARAMQEAKQLDNRMRDAYSQLRRSAYDMGSSAAPVDDSGGVRIKPPRSPTAPAAPHNRHHSREVTLLENGMIVEHVDVRKEEREARERRRKEERRARKSSRSSAADVMSVYSSQSQPAMPEGAAMPYSRYSQTSSLLLARPASTIDRPGIPRMGSQASFSDVHSLGSMSPRRTRFFGFKNFSGGFRSQDSLAPSGMSGSMVDMHVALQREGYPQHTGNSPHDVASPLRRSQIWPPMEGDIVAEPEEILEVKSDEKPEKKKRKGLAKIWRIVTGSNKHEDSGREKQFTRAHHVDDTPLAPPPPLSSLVNRGPGYQQNAARRGSTTSLQSTNSPRLSPPTAPSSVLPSPSSNRMEVDVVDMRQSPRHQDEQEQFDFMGRYSGNDMDARGRNMQQAPRHPSPRPMSLPRPASFIVREKSLPPIPGDSTPSSSPRPPMAHQEIRPRTVFSYDPQQMALGSSPSHDFLPPQAPFRSGQYRRQSFSGTSQPNYNAQTMLPPGMMHSPEDMRKSFGLRYDEFGSSRRSLGRLDGMRMSENYAPGPRGMTMPATTPGKRRSRFGLSSLFGKKQHEPFPSTSTFSQSPSQNGVMMADNNINHNGFQTYPTRSRSSGEDETINMTNGGNSSSRHSAGPSTLGGMSRKQPLDKLVAQDTEFVAYRYPSNDQRLDLLR